MTGRRAELRTLWVSLDQAARLVAGSPATVRGWIRRGAVRSEESGGQTMVSLDDVVARALRRERSSDTAVLQAQVDAALTELDTTARELAKAAAELAGSGEQYARREQWMREQHDRELREVYNQWELERSQRDRLPREREPEPVTLPMPVPVDPQPVAVAPSGHVTSRPPVDDDLLPPLNGGSTASRRRPADEDITPAERPKLRWHPLKY